MRNNGSCRTSTANKKKIKKNNNNKQCWFSCVTMQNTAIECCWCCCCYCETSQRKIENYRICWWCIVRRCWNSKHEFGDSINQQKCCTFLRFQMVRSLFINTSLYMALLHQFVLGFFFSLLLSCFNPLHTLLLSISPSFAASHSIGSPIFLVYMNLQKSNKLHFGHDIETIIGSKFNRCISG